MTESTNDKRPVRKLTVKNFSVIKEAELEFGKITVLIGPQSSGKSLLCKLAYFLGTQVVDIAINFVSQQFTFAFFEATIKKEFAKWFPKSGWGAGKFEISFSSSSYEVRISSKESDIQVRFSGAFREAYIERLAANAAARHSDQINAPDNLLSSLATLSLRWLSGRGLSDRSIYIPLERSYFVDTRKGYSVLDGDYDSISASFARLFANSLSSGLDRPRIARFLKGDVESVPGDWSFAFADGRRLPLNELSAGSKETLPIFSVLDLFEKRLRSPEWDPASAAPGRVDARTYAFDEFIIEEPEASVFPTTQYEMMKEFSELSNGIDFRPHFTITTHSPYILSSFNNLIFAGQLGRDKRLKKKLKIDERFWIEPGTFRAYSIHDGKLESILSESGLINGDYLDSVSETIGSEFDEMLRLEYGKKKAS